MIFSSSIRLPKHSTECLPRSKESNERKRTAKVLVLIPPAVEPEEPPTNMSAMVVKMTTFLTAPGPESGKTLNPAVRGETAVKKEEKMRSCQGRSDSARIKSRVGIKISRVVVTKTTFVCKA